MDIIEKLTKLKLQEKKGYCNLDPIGRPTPAYMYEVDEKLMEEVIAYIINNNKERLNFIENAETKISLINKQIDLLKDNLNWYKVASYFLSFIVIIYSLIIILC